MLRAYKRKENGSTMVEFALVLPILAFILMALVDIGYLLSQYLTLTQIAREGVRAASSTPELIADSELATFCTYDYDSSELLDCNSASDTEGAAERHEPIHQKIRTLIEIEAFSFNGDLTYRTIYSSSFDDADRVVAVSVTAHYRSFFNIFTGLRLHVEARGPYLA